MQYKMRKESKWKLYAYEFDALRYDVGDKFGMFKATVEFWTKTSWITDKVKPYLLDLIKRLWKKVCKLGNLKNSLLWSWEAIFYGKEKRKKDLLRDPCITMNI